MKLCTPSRVPDFPDERWKILSELIDSLFHLWYNKNQLHLSPGGAGWGCQHFTAASPVRSVCSAHKIECGV
jgi:hypothetical protein